MHACMDVGTTRLRRMEQMGISLVQCILFMMLHAAVHMDIFILMKFQNRQHSYAFTHPTLARHDTKILPNFINADTTAVACSILQYMCSGA